MTMLLERNPPILLPNRNPHGINPALLTFDEYYQIQNEKDQHHPQTAYDTTVKKLSSYLPKSSYPKLYRRVKINGISFEIRILEDKDGEWGIGVFDGDKRVAAVQDEWGCWLVMVAREYRGFGLGPMLSKMALTIEPDRPSGGFTPGGYKTFVKAYQSMVRDALSSGLYHGLITQGKMSVQRAKAIIASANLPKQEIKPPRDLNSNDPKSWLVYVGEAGDFVVYDRKLRELLAENDDRDDYWINQMLKGFAYVQIHEGHEGYSEPWAMLRQFGADTAGIKKFLINCAVQYTNVENTALYLEPAEIEFIDKRMIDRIEGPSRVRGFTSYKVIPTGETFDYSAFGALERRWRKSFDRYDEFYYQMIELAQSKFQANG